MLLLRLAEAAAALSISDAGPGLCPALRPGGYSPAVPRGAEAEKSVPHPIAEGHGGRARAGGGRAAAGGGGEQARPGRGGAPRSSRSLRGHQAQAPPLTARPSSPRSTHGHRLREARRPPPPTEPAGPRQRRALTRPGPAAAQRTQQAPPQAPPPVPRRPHPDSTRHSSSVGPRLLRP